MSCDLSSGRLEVCKDSVGGLKAVYFVNYGDLGAITYDVTNTDVIDAVAGTPSAYKYELKGASTFTQNVNSSRENGTTFWEQVLELTFKKLTVKDHKELKDTIASIEAMKKKKLKMKKICTRQKNLLYVQMILVLVVNYRIM